MDELKEKSIFILREADARFTKLALLWSGGKDSIALVALCRQAFDGKIPFPVIYIDNGIDFPEVYTMRDELKRHADVIEGRSLLKMNDTSGVGCCGDNKTEALKKIMRERHFEGLIVGIRRDEHAARAHEQTFSPRDAEWRLRSATQMSDTTQHSAPVNVDHTRIHPLLDWRERDVWSYIRDYKVPVNPLYLSRDGKRYRSLGCTRCTASVSSPAKTIDDILQELSISGTGEREGRSRDKEDVRTMERRRSLGYM